MLLQAAKQALRDAAEAVCAATTWRLWPSF